VLLALLLHNRLFQLLLLHGQLVPTATHQLLLLIHPVLKQVLSLLAAVDCLQAAAGSSGRALQEQQGDGRNVYRAGQHNAMESIPRGKKGQDSDTNWQSFSNNRLYCF
jgi:hypothetical protein